MLKGRSRSALGLALLVGVLTLGCRHGEDSPFARRPNRNVPLRVENNNFLDITVYVTSSGGGNLRLGQVTGKSSGTFALDPRKVVMSSGIQLLVDPLGSSRAYLSPLVYPDRGGVVLLVVAAEITQSYITIR